MQFTKDDLTVAINFYQDRASLDRSVASVAGKAKLLGIDGKYPEIKDGPNLSDDGSRDIILKCPNATLFSYPISQVQKRQMYFELCNTKLLLVLDSDEYIEGDWDAFYKNCSEQIDTNYNTYGIPGDDHPRLFYQPNIMEYCDNRHFLIKRKDAPLIKDQFQPTGSIHKIIEGITVRTDDKLRKPEWERMFKAYQKGNMLREDVKGFYWENVKRLRADDAKGQSRIGALPQ